MRAGLKVAILANGPAEVAESLIPALFRDAAPDTIVASGTHGVRKPEPAAFKAVADALSVPLDECFFIDDTPMHVEGARAVGMQSFHFQQDFAELESALRAAGVEW
jgi:putative hydrolase of the HAD superfamily